MVTVAVIGCGFWMDRGTVARSSSNNRPTRDAWAYGLSILLGVVGLGLELFNSAARSANVGLFLFVAGAATGGGRLLFDRIAELNRTVRRIEDLQPPATLGPIAYELWRREVQGSRRRIGAINSGTIKMTSEDDIYDHLRVLAENAQHAACAIDFIGMYTWFSTPALRDYLNRQLGRVRSILLRRLHFFEPDELDNPDLRVLLAHFVTLHERAGAEIRLCPRNVGETYRSDFFPRQGMLMVDPPQPRDDAHGNNTAVFIGRIGGHENVEKADVYLGPTDYTLRLVTDFERCWNEVTQDGSDSRARVLIEPYLSQSHDDVGDALARLKLGS